MLDNLFRVAFHHDSAIMNDIGTVYNIQRLADIVVGDKNAKPVILKLADKTADFTQGTRVNAGQRLIKQQ